MELKLDNKIVLITGGTGGIGRQICLDFLEEKAIVVCAIRNEEKFEELKKWLVENGQSDQNIHSLKCDLTSKIELDIMMKTITDEFGSLDILVNCIGTVDEVPFAMMDEERISRMLDINLKSVMLISQAALRPMFLQKSGCIINISTVLATKGGRGVVPYAAAKAGIDSFTRSLASEVGKKNIRVNGVRPGAIDTPMSHALKDRTIDIVPNAMILGRFGKPNEVSKGVLFLASEETASYITGTFINIDGGYMV